MKQLNKGSINAEKLCITAMLSAFFAICAWACIPMPGGMAFTLQSFGIALGGYLLSPSCAVAAYAVYLLIGAVGFPVFSSFTGGIGHLAGVTGGYLIGFFALAFFCGLSVHFKSRCAKILFGLCGLILCHICGVLWFSFSSGNSLAASFFTATAPYILKDIISVALAFVSAEKLKKALKKAGL